MRNKQMVGLAIAIGILIGSFEGSAAQPRTAPRTPSMENWVATWATSQELAKTIPDRPMIPPGTKRPDFSNFRGPRPSQTAPTVNDNQTVRMIVHTSIGSKRIRVELSNAFGKGTVSIGGARVALRTTGSEIDPKGDRQLTFSGSQQVDLRPGEVVVSDPADLEVKPISDLAISLFVSKSDNPPTNHTIGLHTAYLADGDQTSAQTLRDAATNTTYMWLRSVDVAASPGDFAIVCLGDSITDGYATTSDRDQGWPALLAKRFADSKLGAHISVINEGISGNQVLRDGAGVSALARLDRDVLTEPGVRWVILLEGINDINIHGQVPGPGVLTAEDLIVGYKQIIARAHMQNVKIMGATLTPDMGVFLSGPVGEATRQKANEWIRNSGAFDAVVDLDAALRDKSDPTKLREDFDSGDHIHPNDAGNRAMADAFNLSTFVTSR
jgi:lysophospholipase L1-like esterase